MSDKPLIMIVDDEPPNCLLLKKTLEEAQYNTMVCQSGRECLTQLEQLEPDIILLDVLMPELSGYEVCEKIRSIDKSKNISVVFISALDTVDDRLKGYIAGGDDYLGKPVDLSIVLKKIELLLEHRKQKHSLAAEVKEAQEGFMTALNMGAESGMVSAFIEKSFLAQNYHMLFSAFFNCMQEFQLKTAAQIRFEGELLTLNSDCACLPLEQELLKIAQNEGRLLDFERRMFINFEHFSILVKNLPVHDNELCGRLRDHLAVIASAANARVKSIGNEQNLKKHMDLSNLFHETTSAVETIQKSLDMDLQRALEVTQRMGQDIDQRVLFLGLEEDQEKILMEIIDDSTKELLSLISNKDMIHDGFEKILGKMNNALKYANS